MLPSFLSYGVSVITERKQESISVFLITCVMLAAGISRTIGVLIAILRPDFQATYHWTLAYEASLLFFFPTIPFFLKSILVPGKREKRFHSRMIVLGGILAGIFMLVILIRPESYHRALPIDQIADPVEMGRGDYVLAGYIAMILLFGFSLYALVSAILAWNRAEGQPYFTSLIIGMSITIILVAGEFYQVFTGNYLDPFPRYVVPRTLVAMTVFSVTAIISMTQKASADAKEVDRDRNEAKRSRDELAKVAYTDEMTGLLNRPAMFRDAAEKHSPSRWMLVVDIDNLAFINSYLGYTVGDNLIREVSQICASSAPMDAQVYRVNADIFAIIMTGNGDKAVGICKHILTRIRELEIHNSDNDHFTASIGIAAAESDLKWDEWINRANTALERAKLGRDRYIVFNPELHNDEKRRQDIIVGMRRSLDDSGFRLVYQPIVTGDGNLIGAEALARWEHPDLGPISPDEFIPLAEATGLITRLTLFVVRRSIEDFCGLSNQCTDMKVSINLSGRDLTDPNLLQNLDAIVMENPGAESLLGFEVTETDLIADKEVSFGNLSALRNRGYSISLDDFGTGYSSLSYLSELPLDRLKVDRSFIVDLPGDTRRATLLDAIIRLGDDLNLELIVEGVENEDQLQFLITRDCRLFQGYHFAAPMSIEAFRKWSKERK